jgi:hypothetical protein
MKQQQQEFRPAPKVTNKDIQAAAERLKNWGKWSPDDHVNYLPRKRIEDEVPKWRDIVNKAGIQPV